MDSMPMITYMAAARDSAPDTRRLHCMSRANTYTNAWITRR